MSQRICIPFNAVIHSQCNIHDFFHKSGNIHSNNIHSDNDIPFDIVVSPTTIWRRCWTVKRIWIKMKKNNSENNNGRNTNFEILRDVTLGTTLINRKTQNSYQNSHFMTKQNSVKTVQGKQALHIGMWNLVYDPGYLMVTPDVWRSEALSCIWIGERKTLIYHTKSHQRVHIQRLEIQSSREVWVSI